MAIAAVEAVFDWKAYLKEEFGLEAGRKKQMKTLEMLLREGTEILETAEIGEARLDAWLLLEYITGKNRA